MVTPSDYKNMPFEDSVRTYRLQMMEECSRFYISRYQSENILRMYKAFKASTTPHGKKANSDMIRFEWKAWNRCLLD